MNGGSMRYTINLHAAAEPASVSPEAGFVVFNGRRLLPFEADMLGQALSECADRAESMAAEKAAQLQPVEA